MLRSEERSDDLKDSAINQQNITFFAVHFACRTGLCSNPFLCSLRSPQIKQGNYDNNVPFRFIRGLAKKEVDKDKSLARLR